MNSTYGYISTVPFNKLFVADFKNERPIHSSVLLEEHMKQVVFINGININFMRDLLRLQAQHPLLYSSQDGCREFPYLPIHSKVSVCVNTGPSLLRVYDKFSVIPPIYKNGKVVTSSSGYMTVYPLWTVSTVIFQTYLNNILSCAKWMFELKNLTDTYSSQSIWKHTVVECVDKVIKNNNLWTEMLTSVAYEKHTERDHVATVHHLLDIIWSHWLPILQGTVQSKTVPLLPTGKMVEKLMSKMADFGRDKDEEISKISEQMSGFETRTDTQTDRQEEQLSREVKNSIEALKTTFHHIMDRDLTFTALAQYTRNFDISINGTVKHAKNQFIYPGQEMTINLRPLF